MKRRGIPTLCCFKAQRDSIPCQETAGAQAQGSAAGGQKGGLGWRGIAGAAQQG